MRDQIPAHDDARPRSRAWEAALFFVALIAAVAFAIYFYERNKPKEVGRVDLLGGEAELPLELSRATDLWVWLDVRAGRDMDEYELSDGLRESHLTLLWRDGSGREMESSCDAGNGWSEETSRKKRVRRPYILGGKNACTLSVSGPGTLYIRIKWANGVSLQSASARVMRKQARSP